MAFNNCKVELKLKWNKHCVLSVLGNDNVDRYKEIRKLTTGKGEMYTILCLLDNDDIKNHYRLIAIDLHQQKELDADLIAIYLHQQKELDADLKAIQQIKLVGQLKGIDNRW